MAIGMSNSTKSRHIWRHSTARLGHTGSCECRLAWRYRKTFSKREWTTSTKDAKVQWESPTTSLFSEKWRGAWQKPQESDGGDTGERWKAKFWQMSSQTAENSILRSHMWTGRSPSRPWKSHGHQGHATARKCQWVTHLHWPSHLPGTIYPKPFCEDWTLASAVAQGVPIWVATMPPRSVRQRERHDIRRRETGVLRHSEACHTPGRRLTTRPWSCLNTTRQAHSICLEGIDKDGIELCKHRTWNACNRLRMRKISYIPVRTTLRCQTDHKPLEAIQKKNIANAPPRLQNMLLRLQKYDVNIKYVPGKELILTDALSRLPGHESHEMSGMDVQIHKVQQVSLSKLDKIRLETDRDESLRALREIIRRGWPDSQQDIPSGLKTYRRIVCRQWSHHQGGQASYPEINARRTPYHPTHGPPWDRQD